MSPSPMSLPLRGTRILRECIMMFLCIDSDCSLFLRKNTAQCRTGAMHNAGGELRLLGILGSSPSEVATWHTKIRHMGDGPRHFRPANVAVLCNAGRGVAASARA